LPFSLRMTKLPAAARGRLEEGEETGQDHARALG
jgi:hypothetical protein